jgi:hypothetical protein
MAVTILDRKMLVNQTDAAAIIGISKATLCYHTKVGHPPQPIGRVGNEIMYWRQDVDEEAEDRRIQTQEEGAG